jgi:tetratricopeptide (TPR) repeat protein
MTRLFLLLAALPLWAADPAQVALSARAQADYERIERALHPTLSEAAACVQSQAALAVVAAPADLPVVYFRRGYCALAGAWISPNEAGFVDAAAAFERSLAAWEQKPRRRRDPVEPAPAVVSALAAIARLAGGAADDQLPSLDRRLADARHSGACAASMLPETMCRQTLAAAAAWQGWIAVRQRRYALAASLFEPAPAPAWLAWVEGRMAYDGRRYADAVTAFRRAVDGWTAEERQVRRRIPDSLTPPPALAAALVDLAEAHLAAGDAHAALATLEPALRRDPRRAWSLFLRGRAREEAGDPVAAVSDFNLAARAAFAAGEDDRSAGEARFYRGVWSFRRGDVARAEQEFAAALNGGLSAPLSAEATAWRALAAVSTGACGASRDLLESAAAAASPLFPRREARSALAACPAPPARISEVR